MTIQDFFEDFNIHYCRNSNGISWIVSNKQTGEARGFGFNTNTTDAEFKFYTSRELKQEAADFLWPFVKKSYNITIENSEL